jgi:hypothetical protein
MGLPALNWARDFRIRDLPLVYLKPVPVVWQQKVAVSYFGVPLLVFDIQKQTQCGANIQQAASKNTQDGNAVVPAHGWRRNAFLSPLTVPAATDYK